MRRWLLWTSALMVAGSLAACGHGEDIGKDRPPPSRLVGLACDNDNDCEQYCSYGTHNVDLPGGFCTVRGCRRLEDCPSGTVCIANDDGICVYPCAGPLDCTSDFLGRTGYTCRFQSGYNQGDVSASQYDVCVGN